MNEPTVRDTLKQLLRNDDLRIVISGDSISYNRYDFELEACLNAFDCHAGIESWAFLLRDALIKHDAHYMPAKDIAIQHAKSGTSIVPSVERTVRYAIPMREASKTIAVQESNEQIQFTYEHHNISSQQIVLYFSNDPEYPVTFDIHLNGTFAVHVDQTKIINRFKGYEVFTVSIPAAAGIMHTLSFCNWQSVSCASEASERINRQLQQTNNVARGRLGTIHFIGIGTRELPVFLTGQGSRTAQWLLEHADERIIQHQPNAVFLSIGANDRIIDTPEQFEANLRAIVHRLRTFDANMAIIWITPPSSVDLQQPSNETDGYCPEEKAQQYNQVIHQVADQTGCLALDSMTWLKNVPFERWRFDNIHLTQYGNVIWANQIGSFLNLPASLFPDY